MVQKTPGKRGRPRAYDPEKALSQATDLFWAQGFSATSLDGLSEATKMNRPSLYGAFGDKAALYRATLDRYTREVGGKLAALTASDLPLRELLVRLFGHVLDLYIPDGGPPRGCFIVSTGVPEAQNDPQVRAIVHEAFRSLDGLFERRFRVAVSTGELPDGTDTAMLARMLASVVYFLSIRSRSGESRESLEAFAIFAADFLSRPESAPAEPGLASALPGPQINPDRKPTEG